MEYAILLRVVLLALVIVVLTSVETFYAKKTKVVAVACKTVVQTYVVIVCVKHGNPVLLATRLLCQCMWQWAVRISRNLFNLPD